MAFLNSKFLFLYYLLTWITTSICVFIPEAIKDLYQKNNVNIKIAILADYLKYAKWNNVQVYTNKDPKQIIRHLSSSFLIASLRGVHIYSKNHANFSLSFNSETQDSHRKIVVWCGNVCQKYITFWVIKETLFRKYTWLFVQDSAIENKIFVNFQLNPHLLRLDCNVYVLNPAEYTKEYDFEVCKVLHDGPNNIHCSLRAIHRHSQWWHSKHEHYLPLKGFKLKVGVSHLPPVVEILVKGNSTTVRGFSATLTELMAQYLGFSYEFVIDNTQSFGLLINGSWSGLVGMLVRKEVDFVPVTLSLTPERLRSISMSPFISTVSTVALIRKHNGESDKFDAMMYLRPFPLSMWMTSLGMCIITFICLWYIIRAESLIFCNTLHSTWKEDLWSVVCITVQMGLTKFPNDKSSQIVLIMFFLFMLMISKSYYTFLTASITVKKTHSIYNTIEELLDDDFYRVSIMQALSQCEDLKNAKQGKLERLWKKITMNQDFVTSTEEGVEKTLKQKYVYIIGLNLAAPALASNCNLTYIKQSIIKSTTHIGLQKFSPYHEAISSALLILRSTGILSITPGKAGMESYHPEICAEADNPISVQLWQIIGLFLLLTFGCILAFVVLGVEKYLHKKNHMPI